MGLFNKHYNISYITFIIFNFRKSTSGGATYEMRWAAPEDFMELKVMPRMLLDHLPDNILKVLTTILDQQKSTTESDTSVDE